jgi:hypothetical protein
MANQQRRWGNHPQAAASKADFIRGVIKARQRAISTYAPIHTAPQPSSQIYNIDALVIRVSSGIAAIRT